MFSVIIPTMWYSDKIHRSLPSLNDCDEIGEIILIDNNPSLKPNYLDSITKLKYLPQEENIYVNPAWNLGVKESGFDNLCILNDDIVFNTDVFTFVKDSIHKGVIGMSTGNYYKEGIGLPYTIESMSLPRPWGWGCCIFIHKSNWIHIDERLKIACGDDLLVKYVNGGSWILKNLDIEYKQVSETSGKNEFSEIQKEDIRIWSQF